MTRDCHSGVSAGRVPTTELSGSRITRATSDNSHTVPQAMGTVRRLSMAERSFSVDKVMSATR